MSKQKQFDVHNVPQCTEIVIQQTISYFGLNDARMSPSDQE